MYGHGAGEPGIVGDETKHMRWLLSSLFFGKGSLQLLLTSGSCSRCSLTGRLLLCGFHTAHKPHGKFPPGHQRPCAFAQGCCSTRLGCDVATPEEPLSANLGSQEDSFLLVLVFFTGFEGTTIIVHVRLEQ